ncbi:MAG: hypothetical protein FWD42_08390, partial [Solirubrobacterales bacterium]|nr:hypothetical protein [Solirubrobacterales bacterium]
MHRRAARGIHTLALAPPGVLVALALAPALARAADTTVNFDTEPDGKPIASGTAIEKQYESDGIVFGEGPHGRGLVPSAMSTPGAHSAPNVLNIEQGGACGLEVNRVEMDAKFAAPRNHVSMYVGDTFGLGGEKITLTGYDLSGNVVASSNVTTTFPDTKIDNKLEIVDPQSRIAFIRVEGPGASSCVAIDDVSFDEVPKSAAADFGLTVFPQGTTVLAGKSASVTLTVHRSSGSSGPIALAAGGLPTGVSASFGANPTSGGDGSTVTVELSAAANAPPAIGAKVTITGTPGGAGVGPAPRSATFELAVSGNFDLRAQGIDVTQGVQRTTGVLLPSGGGSGQQYNGVPLVAGKGTAVRFYADAHGAPAGGVPGAGALLHAYRNGVELADSPLYTDYGPASLPDTGEPDPAPVFEPERESERNAYTFTLPEDWTTAGTITLKAEVLPPLPTFTGPQYVECSAPSCGENNSFTLNGVTFNGTENVTLATVAMSVNKKSPVAASETFADAKLVTPLSDTGFQILPYAATIDVTKIVESKKSAREKASEAKALVDEWANNNGNPGFARIGVLPTGINGLTSGHSSVVVYAPEPNTGNDRPFTSVAHEMFHLFGLAHASVECGGGQDGDGDDGGETGTPWPLKLGDSEDVVEAVEGTPTNDNDPNPSEGFGQAMMLGLNMSTHPYTVLADGLGGVSEYYDFMSYCSPTRGFGDGGNWISAINWEKVFERFRSPMGASASAGGPGPGAGASASGAGMGGAGGAGGTGGPGGQANMTATAASAAARGAHAHAGALAWVASVHPSRLRVTAFVTAEGTHIASVGPAIGPALPAGSSTLYTLTAHGARGQALATVPMSFAVGHVDGFGPLDELTAEVPAVGADSVTLAAGGTVLATRVRDRHPPRVVVTAPRAGARVGGKRSVLVRWRASDRDHRQLIASIDYSRDGGHSWRTIFIGANTGSALLPGFYFAGSHAARVRVRVNDGFNQVAASSGRFTASSSPPQVQITRPLPAMPGDARVTLKGGARDQLLRALSGRNLRWFDGGLALG